MSKLLKDILKQAHDTIKGVRHSTTEPVSTGKDPGVDYKPKAGDEDNFIAKHSVQKWDEPTGNIDPSTGVKYSLDTPQNSRMGNNQAKSKATNEEVINELSPATKSDYRVKAGDEAKRLRTRIGIMNKVKSDDDVVKSAADNVKKDMKRKLNNRVDGILRSTRSEETDPGFSKLKDELNELSTDLLHRAAHKAAKVAMTDVQGRSGPIFKKRAAQANKFRAKGMEQEKKERAMKEETLDEVVINRQMTPKEKAAKAAYIKKHSAKLAAHDTGTSTPKKSFKDVNTERGDYTHQPSKMGLRHAIGAGYYKAEETIHEVLTKSTTAGETIHDFVHSKDPKFAGKSKEKRKEMALAAYYAKQRNEEVKEAYAVQPLLGSVTGSSDIAKYKTDDTQDEIDMVRTELKAIANKTMHMLSNMPADHHIEPWVQSKIAAAKEMIGSVHDYMMYSDHEEDEQMDTPITLPNMSVDVNTGQNV